MKYRVHTTNTAPGEYPIVTAHDYEISPHGDLIFLTYMYNKLTRTQSFAAGYWRRVSIYE